MSPVHKSIMSPCCLYWQRCAVKSCGDKLWESTAVAMNPSSPSPCNAPKPQSLCSDHSGPPCLVQRDAMGTQIRWTSHVSFLSQCHSGMSRWYFSAHRRQCITLGATKFITSMEKQKAQEKHNISMVKAGQLQTDSQGGCKSNESFSDTSFEEQSLGVWQHPENLLNKYQCCLG